MRCVCAFSSMFIYACGVFNLFRDIITRSWALENDECVYNMVRDLSLHK